MYDLENKDGNLNPMGDEGSKDGGIHPMEGGGSNGDSFQPRSSGGSNDAPKFGCCGVTFGMIILFVVSFFIFSCFSDDAAFAFGWAAFITIGGLILSLYELNK